MSIVEANDEVEGHDAIFAKELDVECGFIVGVLG